MRIWLFVLWVSLCAFAQPFPFEVGEKGETLYLATSDLQITIEKDS